MFQRCNRPLCNRVYIHVSFRQTPPSTALPWLRPGCYVHYVLHVPIVTFIHCITMVTAWLLRSLHVTRSDRSVRRLLPWLQPGCYIHYMLHVPIATFWGRNRRRRHNSERHKNQRRYPSTLNMIKPMET